MLPDGVSMFDVAGVLGTGEQVISNTYGHHSVEQLRRAVNVWSRRSKASAQVISESQTGGSALTI